MDFAEPLDMANRYTFVTLPIRHAPLNPDSIHSSTYTLMGSDYHGAKNIREYIMTIVNVLISIVILIDEFLYRWVSLETATQRRERLRAIQLSIIYDRTHNSRRERTDDSHTLSG